jgi:hypothetical protein
MAELLRSPIGVLGLLGLSINSCLDNKVLAGVPADIDEPSGALLCKLSTALAVAIGGLLTGGIPISTRLRARNASSGK